MEKDAAFNLEESVDAKKRPKKRAVIILIVSLAFVIAAAIAVLMTWPFYPAFVKDVGSYHELSKVLSKEANLILVDLSASGHKDVQYRVKLDGRNLRSKTEGYQTDGSLALLDKEITTDVSAEPQSADSLGEHQTTDHGDWQYRDVEIATSVQSSSTHHWIEQVFNLKGFTYRLSSSYALDKLDSDEMKHLDDELSKAQAQLIHQIVDEALTSSIKK